MIIRPSIPSHGPPLSVPVCTHTLPVIAAILFLFCTAHAYPFHPLVGSPRRLVPSCKYLDGPRRGLVAKMQRCLSYNMLAMHLEREHVNLPGVFEVVRFVLAGELLGRFMNNFCFLNIKFVYRGSVAIILDFNIIRKICADNETIL